MIVIIAKIPVRPDQREAFLGAVPSLVQASNAEPGVISYQCYESTDTENLFVMVEEYESQEAVDAHFASEHFQGVAANLGDLVSGPPEIKSYQTDGPKVLQL